jgi:hypothetical protein
MDVVAVVAVGAVGFGDRFGDRPQGRSAVQGAVRPVLIVEGLELAERVEQVGLVPDQGAVEEFVSAGLHPPPAFGREVPPVP